MSFCAFSASFVEGTVLWGIYSVDLSVFFYVSWERYTSFFRVRDFFKTNLRSHLPFLRCNSFWLEWDELLTVDQTLSRVIIY